MKFDQQLYKNYVLPKNEKFHDKFEFPEDIDRITTFQENKKLPLYSWFPYKQGFSRALVHRIIKRQNISLGQTVCDPFLGSGTTVLACIEQNIAANGIDILPLCQFISATKVQATLIDPEEILEGAKEIRKGKTTTKYRWPNIQIVEKAVPGPVKEKLMLYKDRIENSKLSNRIKNVLLLALAATIDSCCFAKKDGGFPRIVRDRQICDTDEVFWDLCQAYSTDLKRFKKEHPSLDRDIVVSCQIQCGDARNAPLKDLSIDSTITSPPYLNKTDYTRIYSIELSFLFIRRFEEIRDLRYRTFCSHVEAKPVLPPVDLPIELLKRIKILSQSKLTNPRHPQMVEGYFQDLHHCLKDNYRYLKNGGYAAWVVWNSSLSGIQFPVDVLLAEIAENIGFNVEAIECVRLTGTSAQQAKLYGDKVLRESVVYLRKKRN